MAGSPEDLAGFLGKFCVDQQRNQGLMVLGGPTCDHRPQTLQCCGFQTGTSGFHGPERCLEAGLPGQSFGGNDGKVRASVHTFRIVVEIIDGAETQSANLIEMRKNQVGSFLHNQDFHNQCGKPQRESENSFQHKPLQSLPPF